MKHIPALDGLRGIAILLVLFYHFLRFNPITPEQEFIKKISEMGYMGVDLFFVLSGFLISGILFTIIENGHGLKLFYIRRVLRIFPAYFFLLAILFFIVPIFISEIPYKESVENSYIFWLYFSNFYIGINGFNSAPFLTHTWSLAVEEQFYLFFPFILPFFKKNWHWIAFIALIVICRYFFWIQGMKTMNYVGIINRMDSFVIGSFFQLLFRRRSVIPSPKILLLIILSFWILIGLSSSGFKPSSFIMQTIGFSFNSIFFGYIIYLCSLNDYKFLKSKYLIFFGKYSYGIYLVHVPVLKFIEFFFFDEITFGLDLVKFFLLSFIFSVSLALISWFFVEKPFLGLKKYFSYSISPTTT